MKHQVLAGIQQVNRLATDAVIGNVLHILFVPSPRSCQIKYLNSAARYVASSVLIPVGLMELIPRVQSLLEDTALICLCFLYTKTEKCIAGSSSNGHSDFDMTQKRLTLWLVFLYTQSQVTLEEVSVCQTGKMLLFSFSFLVGLCSCVYVQLCLLVCVVVYVLRGGVCFVW